MMLVKGKADNVTCHSNILKMYIFDNVIYEKGNLCSKESKIGFEREIGTT